MFGIHDYWLFIGTGILLNLTPGQDTMFILGRSLAGGLRAGVASAFGIAVGSIGHTLAAALGFSAIIATSAVAFTVVKLLGAGYLIYLGIKLLLSKVSANELQPEVGTAQADAWSCFRQGILTNLLNPKVALFFLAFLPQFVTTDSPHKAAAFALLGLICIFNGTLWCLGVAVFAAGAAGRIRKSAQAFAWINRGLGGLFVYLGVRVAMAETR
jgi:threonine/homoserine/homoserine lactone efflux protein